MRGRSVVASAGLMVVFLFLRPGSAAACSPPFEQPTIAALGPAQVVVVGMTGERVGGGRLFHVTRWFNGQGAVTPIVPTSTPAHRVARPIVHYSESPRPRAREPSHPRPGQETTGKV